MIYVVVEELIPESQEGSHNNIALQEVPFYQIVFRGYVNLASTPINLNSEKDDLCAVRLGAPGDQLKEHENGFLYIEEDGDNRYYVEPLGNHYFYYEAHF